MKRLLIVPLLILIASGLILGGWAAQAPAPAAAQEKTWNLRFTSFLPPMSPGEKLAHVPCIKRIEEATKGRVKITFYQAGAIATAFESWQAIESGLADLGYIPASANYPGRTPLTGLLTLPMMGVPSQEIGAKVMTDIYNKFPEIQKEYSSLKTLFFQCSPSEQISTTKVPVRSLEDLKGLKLRSAGTVVPKFLKSMGATPLAMPVPDMYLSLERGIIDGIQFNVMGIRSWKLWKVLKYHTMVNISTNVWVYAFNHNTWNKLPSDIQDAIWNTLGGHKGAVCTCSIEDKIAQEDIKFYGSPEVGDELIYPSEEELQRWRDASRPVWDAEIAKLEAKGLPAQAIVDDIIRLIEKYEGEK